MPSGISPVASGRRDALPHGAVLRDYTLEAVLGHGGFGIVYRARHNLLAHRVAIKEYLPLGLAVREGESVHPGSPNFREYLEDGRRRFQEEAQALIKFRHHPSIVTCMEFFEANGTAYLVMEYEDGLPLSEVLRKRELEGRPFTEADLLELAIPLLEGLWRVHQAGVVHRDIKPANIFVRRRDHTPVLIDFGAAKQEVAAHSRSMAPYTPGYAAFEQVSEGPLGPWTDVYAVGAVLWRMVAGSKLPAHRLHPVKVESRMAAKMRKEEDPLPSASQLGAGRFAVEVLKTIDQCLALQAEDRFRDCNALLEILLPKAESRTGGFPVRVERSSQKTLGNVGESDSVRHGSQIVKRRKANRQLNLGQIDDGGNDGAQDACRTIDWQKAADQGDVDAQYRLGRMYHIGEDVSQSYFEAVKWYRKAADQGHSDAQNRLGCLYEYGLLGISQNFSEAVHWYRKAADQGHSDAQNRLGGCYALGRGVPKNHKDAIHWYRKAADQGEIFCQLRLGRIYEYGEDVSQSHAEALKWYRKAADQGSGFAQSRLGDLYRYGRCGLSQNFSEAAHWYRKAAAQGDVFAKYMLGWCYDAGGFGLSQNSSEAFRWYREAAEEGYENAPLIVGFSYWFGERVSQNRSEAVRWFRKAADKGNAYAQSVLGGCYGLGIGVSQNRSEAVRWFRKAADQGHASSQFALGSCYDMGIGVSQNGSEAARWYRKAAAQGHSDACKILPSDSPLDARATFVGKLSQALRNWHRRRTYARVRAAWWATETERLESEVARIIGT